MLVAPTFERLADAVVVEAAAMELVEFPTGAAWVVVLAAPTSELLAED